MLSSNPWKLLLQNRYVCPDGIFPGPLLASGPPKIVVALEKSHLSSHFIGPSHLLYGDEHHKTHSSICVLVYSWSIHYTLN